MHSFALIAWSSGAKTKIHLSKYAGKNVNYIWWQLIQEKSVLNIVNVYLAYALGRIDCVKISSQMKLLSNE